MFTFTNFKLSGIKLQLTDEFSEGFNFHYNYHVSISYKSFKLTLGYYKGISLKLVQHEQWNFFIKSAHLFLRPVMSYVL